MADRDTPDPGRPFWSLGRAGAKPLMRHHTAGAAVPADALYWCHEGDGEWTPNPGYVAPADGGKKRGK